MAGLRRRRGAVLPLDLCRLRTHHLGSVLLVRRIVDRDQILSGRLQPTHGRCCLLRHDGIPASVPRSASAYRCCCNRQCPSLIRAIPVFKCVGDCLPVKRLIASRCGGVLKLCHEPKAEALRARSSWSANCVRTCSSDVPLPMRTNSRPSRSAYTCRCSVQICVEYPVWCAPPDHSHPSTPVVKSGYGIQTACATGSFGIECGA